MTLELKGHIDIDIKVPPPHVSVPAGDSRVEFAIQYNTNGWRLETTFPSNYFGYKRFEQRTFSTIKDGNDANEYVVRTMELPDGRVWSLAGLDDDWSPLHGMSGNAPEFLIWLAFLNNEKMPEMIPRLFYDQRLNSDTSPHKCRALVRVSTNGIPIQMDFFEVRPNGPDAKVAQYSVFETTNCNGRTFPLRVKLVAELLIPQFSGSKVFLRNGWVGRDEYREDPNSREKIPGGVYSMYVDAIDTTGEPVETVLNLRSSIQYEISDGRFEATGGDMPRRFFTYRTNRWLTRVEAETFGHPEKIPYRVEVTHGSRKTVLTSVILINLALLSIVFAKWYRAKAKLNNK